MRTHELANSCMQGLLATASSKQGVHGGGASLPLRAVWLRPQLPVGTSSWLQLRPPHRPGCRHQLLTCPTVQPVDGQTNGQELGENSLWVNSERQSERGCVERAGWDSRHAWRMFRRGCSGSLSDATDPDGIRASPLPALRALERLGWGSSVEGRVLRNCDESSKQGDNTGSLTGASVTHRPGAVGWMGLAKQGAAGPARSPWRCPGACQWRRAVLRGKGRPTGAQRRAGRGLSHPVAPPGCLQ